MSDVDTASGTDRVRAALQAASGSISRTRLLLIPLLLFDLLVFVVPMGYLLRISFAKRSVGGGALQKGTWSFDGYQYLLDSSVVGTVFRWTLLFGVVATLLAVAIGTLYAYAAWRASGTTRTILLAGVVMSMFTTLVVKLFAARLMLSPEGAVNDTLLATGVLDGRLLLVNNEIGVLIGQLYIVLPYTVLAVYSVLTGLDEGLVEAANDLGATPVRAIREVVLPHAVPGMAVGGIIAFAWSAGAFAAPLLLGSASERTVAIEVQNLLGQFNYPGAAALAVVLTTVVLVVLALGIAWLRRRGGLRDV
ncbi:MAG: ABC-type spermidine/putrescine transport system, permease component I [halophilic archaeon J07HX64]|jgi:ABC-type spermidine/putrescine transport system, permease component I|nr:MAG: ABC-type spermidine/putrescine transport system, permease component I [halophilic archaeon J07HX64]